MSDRPLIIFDIGNVLLRFSLERAARNFDRVEAGAGGKICRYLWASSEGLKLETGRTTGWNLFRSLRRTLGLKMSYAQFCRGFNEIFDPVHANMKLLRILSRRYPVALLSNTNPIHWKYIMSKYPALRSARWMCSSHLFGRMKPDPRIYKSLAKKTGTPLNKMIFIDDREENIEAARGLGMKTIHFTGDRGLEESLALLGVFCKNGKT
ncbi:MAG: HAD family phosphatase [Elusimicrobia bacterium]|nr:HAD family phosphatase [Elusimicrobiota bacterium]